MWIMFFQALQHSVYSFYRFPDSFFRRILLLQLAKYQFEFNTVTWIYEILIEIGDWKCI